MKLYRLQLSHFRQYKNEEIFFPDTGLIGVLGLNGAGKSTLFNAIGWCLYGKIKGVPNAMIKNQRSDKKDRCFVEIDFLYQGQFYRIHRDLESSRCYAEIEGITKAIGTTNLNSFVEDDLFKMDYKAFTVCYYAQQDDFDALSKLTPGPRIQALSQLLQVDSIDIAAENKRKEKRSLEEEVESYRKQLKDVEKLLEEKELHETTIALHKEKISSDQSLIISETNRLKDLSLLKLTGEKDYRRHAELTSEMKFYQEKIDMTTSLSLQTSERNLSSLLLAKSKYDLLSPNEGLFLEISDKKESLSEERVTYVEKKRLEKDRDSLHKQLEQLNGQLKPLYDILSKFGSLEESLPYHREQLNQTQDLMQNMRESYAEQQATSKSIQQKLTELAQEKQQFTELGDSSPCPTCRRPLGEHYGDTLLDIQQKSLPLNKEYQDIVLSLTQLATSGKETKETFLKEKEHLAVLEKQWHEYQTALTRTESLEKQLSDKKEEYDKKQQEYLAFKDLSFDEDQYQQVIQEHTRLLPIYRDILAIKPSLTDIPKLESEIEESKKNIKEYRKHRENLESELTLLNFDQVSYEKLNEQIEQVQFYIQDRSKQLSQSEMIIQIEKIKLATLSQSLLENEQIKEKIAIIQGRIALLEKVNEVYKQFKIDILSKLAPDLSEIMTQDIDMLTQGKYTQVELDDEYNIYIYLDGVKNPLSFYSGGEQKLAALSLRLSISQLLTEQTGQANIEMLAMDEVLGSMDSDRQDQMIDMLRQLNSVYSQILLVTHSDSVKDMFDYVLEINQDKEKNSFASWNEEWEEEKVRELVNAYNNLTNEDEG